MVRTFLSSLLMAAIALLLATVAVLAVRVGAAQACSPPIQPPSYSAFGATVPADGAADVPIDAGIALDIELHGASGLPREVNITVTEVGSAAAVAGAQAIKHWDRMFAAWKPAAPFKPRTRYRVDAVVRSDAPRPPAARGPEQLSFTFTTGVERASAITLAGRIEASLESYERDDYSTCAPGLCSCVPTARERGTRARLKLPATSGGQSDRGYQALVMVTGDRPYEFPAADRESTQQVFANTAGVLQPGRAGEMMVEGIDDGRAYKPCFALKVVDVAGNARVGDPVCLGVTVAPPENSAAGGCQVGGDGGGGTAWPLGVLMALAVRTAIRRRVRAR